MGRMVETMVGTATRAGTVGLPTKQALTEQLKASLREMLATLIDRAFGLALDTVEGLARRLDEVAARGGLPLNALLGGAKAVHGGRNPVWGAIRGTWAAMSPVAKVALIIALVLGVLLLPLTAVLLLLALIVVAVWAAVLAGSE
jgi:hypothetical protein